MYVIHNNILWLISILFYVINCLDTIVLNTIITSYYFYTFLMKHFVLQYEFHFIYFMTRTYRFLIWTGYYGIIIIGILLLWKCLDPLSIVGVQINTLETLEGSIMYIWYILYLKQYCYEMIFSGIDEIISYC